ncbi:UDP-N-acetyl-D-mannosamine dehydrogenase [Striga asiatica]|uniref:UDP-N-acetyl-D-mannosamine dehydrogenase n=1 Tax=Striga asiatica TaxID=4170 RepID=A0A5A7PHT8_STRAF|nr:UDP-N-acetyl-D-mannosamine dehydrogenase [Striga asiatica]
MVFSVLSLSIRNSDVCECCYFIVMIIKLVAGVESTLGGWKNSSQAEKSKLEPSGPLYGHDYFPGDDDYDYTKPRSNTLFSPPLLSPLTIILESEKTLEEISDMVRHLVNEHPELIPSAKQLLEALDCDCDENKPAQKAMELLKNEHVLQGFVKKFAEGYALLLDVHTLADDVLEGITVADRVALIRRDPSLDACVSAKEDVDIMRGALCILVGYWIDHRLDTWFYEQSTNLLANEQRYTNPMPY